MLQSCVHNLYRRNIYFSEFIKVTLLVTVFANAEHCILLLFWYVILIQFGQWYKQKKLAEAYPSPSSSIKKSLHSSEILCWRLVDLYEQCSVTKWTIVSRGNQTRSSPGPSCTNGNFHISLTSLWRQQFCQISTPQCSFFCYYTFCLWSPHHVQQKSGQDLLRRGGGGGGKTDLPWNLSTHWHKIQPTEIKFVSAVI